MVDLILSPKDIVNKEFQTKWHGYNPNEVDEFLDQIIKDYATAAKEIENLNAEIARLKKQTMTTETTTTSKASYQVEVPSTSATNFDILKRLSNLEKEVFGKKLQNQTEDTEPFHGGSYYVVPEGDDLEQTKQF